MKEQRCKVGHVFTRKSVFWVCVREACPEVRDRFGTPVVIPDHVPADMGVQLTLDIARA